MPRHRMGSATAPDSHPAAAPELKPVKKGLKNDRFAGVTVKPGDIAEVNLKVSETVTHRPAHIPVTVMRGVEDGPTLFVTAAVHGDEINGVAVVRRLLDTLEPDQLRGTLIGVPVVNRFGFHSQDRYLPDRRDMNRFFPGDPGGSMASRIANVLFRKVIAISDAGVDLHTAAYGQSNLCHIRGNGDIPEVRDLMRAFGTPIMVHNDGPKGSLRRAATDAGVPTILFEAGEPSRFQHHVVEIGHEGVLRVMRHMGMIDKRLRRPDLQVLVRKSQWLRSDHGGLLDLSVEPGDLVQANQRVGAIHDPFGRHVDELRSPASGVVLSTATVPLCNPGNAVIHIGHLHKTLKRARTYAKEGGDLGHVHWVEAKRQQRKKAAKKTASAKAEKAEGRPATKKAKATTKKAKTASKATKPAKVTKKAKSASVAKKATKTTPKSKVTKKSASKKAAASKKAKAASKRVALDAETGEDVDTLGALGADGVDFRPDDKEDEDA